MQSRTEDMIASEYMTPTTKTCNEGCVVLYTHDDCVFCSQMKQLIFAVLDKHNLSHDFLVEVDIDDTHANITQFPTVRLCDTFVTGIQPLDRLDASLMRLVLKPCFGCSADFNPIGYENISLEGQNRE